jgi:peptidoglycan hydrolase-like protein with peptidoglycan-binding domain
MNKYLKYTLVALPILVGGYFIYKQLKPKKDKGLPPTPPPPSPTPTTPTTTSGGSGSGGSSFTVRDAFPLKKGSRGEKVTELQRNILASKNDDAKSALGKGGADGIFGGGTEKAVIIILGKGTVDNQAELDKLKSAISSAEATKLREVGEKNRVTFGQAIVDGFGKRQLFTVGSGRKGIIKEFWNATKDRMLRDEVIYFNQGTEVRPWGYSPRVIEKRIAKKGDPHLEGIVYIWVIEKGNNVRYRFSPYDFALV